MKKQRILRITGVLLGVTCMGLSISLLAPCRFGTDGYTALNMAVSARLGLSFGTWQAGLNLLLFVVVLAFGRQYIGLGTFANMLLVGYICDFFTWIWNRILPAEFFCTFATRVAVAVPALGVFVMAAALYMDMNLGTAPYDALPFLLHKAIGKRIPFSVLRVTYDLLVILLGYCFGASFAGVTLAMAFLLGPTVSAVGKWLRRYIKLPTHP